MRFFKHVKAGSGASVCCLLAIFILTTAGCDKTKKPTSDSTPPKLVWNVFNHGTSAQADHAGSPTLNAKRGERYRITLKAIDPEGAQSIQINPTLGSGNMAWQCQDPPGGESVAQNKTAPLAPMTQNLSPDADGNVMTSIFLIYELDFAMVCQANWSFTSGTAKLTGKASNYFGGTTTATITFNVAP